MASPPLIRLLSTPGSFSRVTWLPKRWVTAVRAASFAPVTVESNETMIRPLDRSVIQAVPGMAASRVRVAVMALAGTGGAGLADDACAWAASRVLQAAIPAVARIAAVRRGTRVNFTVSLLTMRTRPGRTRP